MTMMLLRDLHQWAPSMDATNTHALILYTLFHPSSLSISSLSCKLIPLSVSCLLRSPPVLQNLQLPIQHLQVTTASVVGIVQPSLA